MELSSRVLAADESVPSPDGEALARDLQGDPRLAALPAHLVPLRILGQGGSSVVYEALHTRLKVKVALKLLTIDGSYAEHARTRMMREAELYALLDDPRIPRVYDVNELPDGTPYVVMEMVPGESLDELLLRHGPLSANHALSIAREVLLALVSVHERGVLHRDVKPANVILTLSHGGPAQVRLVDFGIAKMSTRGADEDAAVTQRGTLIGTPHYMAPERLAGHPADASTDVYAVGIMLYEMLSGLVPFTGSSLPLIIAAVMREVPLSLEQRGVDVSLALSSLVMRAMAREPSDRFPSARDMLAALEALAGDGTQQGAPACERESIVELPRRRHKLWLATGLTVAVAAATGLLFADERVEPSAAAQPSASAQPVAQERQTTGAPFAGAALAPQVRVPLSPLSLAPASGASSSALSPAEPAQPSVQPSEDAKTHHRHGREARREDEARRELEARESARERDDEARREREDEARRVEARGSAREQNEDESRRERQRAPDFADKALILPENPY